MPAFKFYAWEKRTFPWHYSINIRHKDRVWLTHALARELGLTAPLCVNTTKRGTRADTGKWLGGFLIRLPNRKHKCSLGLILHEISHALTPWGVHHGRPFRSTLCGSMAKTKHLRLVAKCYRDKRGKKK